ncbi:MAG: Gfo/Idh/MocA family oxidoreductase [Acidimicrobiia bacterium]|nr:Gfo/Idh/MocA family oxidoreductase [Acidimicrobiia bacterium]
MRIGVVGTGAVGARVARLLAGEAGVESVPVCGQSPAAAVVVRAVQGTVAAGMRDLRRADAVVLATPAGTHWPMAVQLLRAGVATVSVSDHPSEVRGLLALDAAARERGVSLLLGAAFSPGLTCVLAAHAAGWFEDVEAVHVARQGTGGPACARRYHAALGRTAWVWMNRTWVRRHGGSGRELCWFPDPVGPADCYFGALAEPQLLVPVFPSAAAVTARRAADRQDRLTSRLPMLSPPHAEGGLGAVRVAVCGRLQGESTQRVLGAAHNPAAATATVAATAALALVRGEARRSGAMGLAEALVPLPFLSELTQRGVNPVLFEGVGL